MVYTYVCIVQVMHTRTDLRGQDLNSRMAELWFRTGQQHAKGGDALDGAREALRLQRHPVGAPTRTNQ